VKVGKVSNLESEIWKHGKEPVQEKREAIGSSPFILRLQSAVAKRSADLAELRERFYCNKQDRPTLAPGDMRAVEELYTRQTGIEALPASPEERDEHLNELIDDSKARCRVCRI
jgi:hypothetical protein